jgi:ABC-type uncharacterized transport system auxiliary subunit
MKLSDLITQLTDHFESHGDQEIIADYITQDRFDPIMEASQEDKNTIWNNVVSQVDASADDSLLISTDRIADMLHSEENIVSPKQGFIVELSIADTKNWSSDSTTLDLKLLQVNTLYEASEAVSNYVNGDNPFSEPLGMSTFTGGAITKDGEQVARVSLNGRVWDMDDNLIVVQPESPTSKP